jgi:hypothetical protein
MRVIFMTEAERAVLSTTGCCRRLLQRARISGNIEGFVRQREISLKSTLYRERRNDKDQYVDKAPGTRNPSIHLVVSCGVDSAQSTTSLAQEETQGQIY